MSKLLKDLISRANRTTVETSIGPITVRQMLLRELKQMIDLQEQADQADTPIKVLALMNSCIETEGVDLLSLSASDAERVYLAIHTLTQGNALKTTLFCGQCEQEFQDNLNLDLVAVSGVTQKEIHLDNGLTLNMRAPTMAESLVSAADEQQIFNLAIRCISSVNTGNETLVVGEDLSPEDLKEVIDYLDESGFAALYGFMTDLPTVVLRQPCKCPHCETEDVLSLRGLAEIIS
ncbi:hypothetical protein [Aeromonas jandaei]|uniref:T4 family baseplate hub assembly chaperone n=1 Tax=Aeromonas jandaei TaxID=650 RepID=UPI00366CAF76